jgi:membrane-associated protease RseP (regulator of RpoE activity)
MPIHKLLLIVAALGLTKSLAAQGACPNGPGSAFGIVGYQCANCSFKQEYPRPPIYTFFAEPVVTQVDRLRALASEVTSALQHASGRPVIVVDGVVQGSAAVGDVIEAVDGHPITTQAGADLFTYPTAGAHSLTVRRGRDREVIDVSVPASCATASSGATSVSTGGTSSRRGDDRVHLGVGVGAGSNSATGGSTTSGGSASNAGKGNGYGRGVPAFFGDTIEIVNGSPVIHGSGSSPAIGRFGFAVECSPSCSLNRSPSGDYYYKYDGYPRIVEVRERSAADRAGLRVGDLITKVEGKSILNEDPLRGSEQGNQLHITVRRDGKDIDVSMLVVP